MAWPPEPNNRISPSSPDRADGGTDNRADNRAGQQAGDQADEAGDLADALARFAADARVDQQVAERRRAHWRARQAEEATTFAGLLANLAEIGQPIVLRDRSGGTHRGVLAVVGTDAVALTQPGRRLSLVALDHIVGLDGAQGQSLRGDRPVEGERPSLRHLLAELAQDQPDVALTLAGNTTLHGRLLWVGEDVAAVATPPAHPGQTSTSGTPDWAPRCTYVRLSSVAVASFSVSG